MFLHELNFVTGSNVFLNKERPNCRPQAFKAFQKPDSNQYNELRVFYHHIYEYKKGLRSLVLTTEKKDNRFLIEDKLKRENIPYVINEVNGKNINVFFGNKDCIRVVTTFDKRLDRINPEQDFMLGIMLGYDKILQCKRYFKMRDKFSATSSAALCEHQVRR